MADEPTTQSTGETPTTTGTTIALGAGLGTESPPKPTEGSLAAALGDGKGEQPAGAPETYADWNVPEGYELDKGVAEEALPIFKKLNLTQEQGQELVDFYAKHAMKSQKEAIDYWSKTQADWRESIKNDPVLGKLAGANGNFGPDSQLVTTVNRALDGLQNPKLVSDFKEHMELTGAGNSPAFVRVLYALASKVTEGTSYPTGGVSRAAVSRPTAAAAMYPNLPSDTDRRAS